MIKAYIGDITKVKDVQYICNAANGIGPMGAGVAGAIKRAGGDEIQREAFQVCGKGNVNTGDLYVTTAGKLPYNNILHLVTMKQPGGRTCLKTVRSCLNNLIIFCNQMDVSKVALPALGTGVGGLNYTDVADIYINELRDISNIEFHIVDINKSFIDYINSKMIEE
jgi:O-acetyl-ADP-ribose deacetylase (regulator of RNase III)